MDLLIVERRANWSQWDRLAKTLHQPLHVLIHQSGESLDDLYARVEAKIARSHVSQLNRVVVLGPAGPRDVALTDVHGDVRRMLGRNVPVRRVDARDSVRTA
jgi:broad specificity phosphatase PhoE